jgi:hypothetical protein
VKQKAKIIRFPTREKKQATRGKLIKDIIAFGLEAGWDKPTRDKAQKLCAICQHSNGYQHK